MGSVTEPFRIPRRIAPAGLFRDWGRTGRFFGPELVGETVTEVMLGPERFVRTFDVAGYPSPLRSKEWDRVRCLPMELRLCHHIEPTDPARAVVELGQHIRQLRASLLWSNRSQTDGNPYDEAALQQAVALREALARGTTRLFRHSVRISVFAASRRELDQHSERLLAELSAQLFTIRRALLEQAPAFRACLPGTALDPGLARNMDTEAVAALLPWFGEGSGVGSSGEVWGVDPERHRLVVVDRFAQLNPHAVIAATSGAGKSFFLKSILTQGLARGRAIVIDPQGEYRAWCQALGGVYLSPGEDGLGLALLAPPAGGSDGRRSAGHVLGGSLLRLLETLGPPVSEAERAAVFRGVRSWVERDGGASTFPTLGDWATRIETERGAGCGVALRLRTALEGGLGAIDGSWLPPEDVRLMVFDLRGFLEKTPHLLPAATLLVAEMVLRRYVDPARPLTVAVDEAHLLLGAVPGARLLEQLYRTGRKRGVAMILATQSVHDLLGPGGSPDAARAARAVLANASTVFLMRQQNAAETEELARLYRLRPEEAARLLALGRGEGLALVQGQRALVSVEAPDALVDLFGSEARPP